MSKSKKVIVTLNELKLEALTQLMKADMETNTSAYVGRLITQEVVRRSEETSKKPVGRPKKEEKEVLYYPSPDLKHGNRAPYTLEAWNIYWDSHEKWEPRPELPPPLTKEELRKWDM